MQSKPFLERAQEIEQILLLLVVQSLKEADHAIGLRTGTGMRLYGCEQATIRGRGAAIVKKEDALSQTPQRRGAEFIRASSALGHIISETRTHVVDQEI